MKVLLPTRPVSHCLATVRKTIVTVTTGRGAVADKQKRVKPQRSNHRIEEEYLLISNDNRENAEVENVAVQEEEKKKKPSSDGK